jgi:hypothetical protein
VKEETPIAKEEIPVVKEEIPIAKEEIPVVKEEIPIAKEEIPVVNRTIAVVKEEIPIVNPTIPVLKEEIPVVNEELRDRARLKSVGLLVLGYALFAPAVGSPHHARRLWRQDDEWRRRRLRRLGVGFASQFHRLRWRHLLAALLHPPTDDGVPHVSPARRCLRVSLGGDAPERLPRRAGDASAAHVRDALHART